MAACQIHHELSHLKNDDGKGNMQVLLILAVQYGGQSLLTPHFGGGNTRMAMSHRTPGPRPTTGGALSEDDETAIFQVQAAQTQRI